MNLKIINQPNKEPVTLAEAKGHLRLELEDTSEDSYLNGLILAAREWCDGIQNRAYITQTWQLSLDSFPEMPIKIPKPPLQSLVSVTYKDEAGSVTTIPLIDFVVDTDSDPGRIAFAPGKSWPSVNLYPLSGVKLQFTAGYGNEPVSVPQKVKQAMLLLIGYWYENREAAMNGTVSREIEFSVNALLGFDRVVPI